MIVPTQVQLGLLKIRDVIHPSEAIPRKKRDNTTLMLRSLTHRRSEVLQEEASQ